MSAPAPATPVDANAALSRLSALGLPKLADWLMEPGRGDRIDRPAVRAMIRDVVALSPFHLGYGEPDKAITTAARRRATRTALLIRWATDPRYADDDEPTGGAA